MGRSGARLVFNLTLPYRARCSDRPTISSMRSLNWTSRILGSVFLAKLSSLWVISLHRSPWVRICSSALLNSVRFSVSRDPPPPSRSPIQPASSTMMAIGLLISWAIPAASSPTEASFPASITLFVHHLLFSVRPCDAADHPAG